MKIFILTIFLSCILVELFGQSLGDGNYVLNFEDPSTINHLSVDSVTNHNNLWQVGTPQKGIFTSAYSIPFSILTDTINTYPINDTSSFEIVNVISGDGWQEMAHVFLSGYYQVNSDTLNDFGKIEFSPDNRTTWIDLLTDTIYSSNYQWDFKPVLSGNSDGWQYFQIWLAGLGPIFQMQIGDTIIYRFSFISDSTQTNKEGLMFDNFQFQDFSTYIEENKNNNFISIFPNPTSTEIRLLSESKSNFQSIQICNYLGQPIIEILNFTGQSIDISELKNGIYVLKYLDATGYVIKQFLVQK